MSYCLSLGILSPVFLPASLVGLPESPSLPKVAFPRVVCADVTVIFVSNACLAKVLGIVPLRVMLWVLDSWDTAVPEEIPDR